MGKLKATIRILGILLVSRNMMALYLENVQIYFSTKGDNQEQHKKLSAKSAFSELVKDTQDSKEH